jgi:hypothetical protein
MTKLGIILSITFLSFSAFANDYKCSLEVRTRNTSGIVTGNWTESTSTSLTLDAGRATFVLFKKYDSTQEDGYVLVPYIDVDKSDSVAPTSQASTEYPLGSKRLAVTSILPKQDLLALGKCELVQ